MTTVYITPSSPWTVPTGVTSIKLNLGGGRGADCYPNSGSSGGGKGGYEGWVEGDLAVTPGDVIRAVLGQDAEKYYSHRGGYGGAPDGKNGTSQVQNASGGAGGGGSTTITRNGSTVAVAAGGGGGGWLFSSGEGDGGDGGNPNGKNGTSDSPETNAYGKGATQSHDGADGSTSNLNYSAGGGGGGYFRGGTGKWFAGGGGGSSYAGPLTSVNYTPNGTYQNKAAITYTAGIPPLTPTIVSPNGDVLPTGTANLSWHHNGDDAQKKADIQYRPVAGSTTPHTVSGVGDNWTTSSLSAASYEWRVSTYAQNGVQSQWTSWTPFLVEAAPADPVFTAPALSTTVTGTDITITWTAATQNAYQVENVDPNAVMTWQTGTVESSSEKSITGNVTVDLTTLTIRLRVRGPNLWSNWVTRDFDVAWSVPDTPVVRARPDPASGSLVIAWTQTSGAVDPVSYDVSVIEDGVRRRVATGLDVSAREFIYYIPLSGASVTAVVTAIAATGVFVEGLGG